MIFKIYILGCIISLIIEIITYIRLREFQLYWIVTMFLSWFWVICFFIWVYEMIGWDYEYPKINPYSMIAWRLKRDKK